MPYRDSASTTIYRTRARRRRIFVSRAAGLLAIAAVVVSVVNHQLASSSTQTGSRSNISHHADPGRVAQTAGSIPRAGSDRLGEADGGVPDGTTVFDDGVPAVANLDPDLLEALRRAATDAGRDGVGFVVNSGWRSRT